MSEKTPEVGSAFDNVDFAEVFADTPLADEFDEESSPAESVGAYVGRSVGAWAGGVVGTAVLEPMLSDSEESDEEDDAEASDGESEASESDETDASDESDSDESDGGGEES